MPTDKPTQSDLKAKLKTINAVFYTVFIVWLIFIGVIIYKLILGDDTTSIFIGTIPVIAVLIIMSQIKSKIKKEIDA